jgi:hypothetical protein
MFNDGLCASGVLPNFHHARRDVGLRAGWCALPCGMSYAIVTA